MKEDIVHMQQLKEVPHKVSREVRRMDGQRAILRTAELVSAIFRPNYYALLGFLILFLFTYLQMLPFVFKAWVVCIVYVFTIVFPAVGIYIYRNYRGWTNMDLRHRHNRLVPYVIHIICNLACVHFVWNLRFPLFALGILGIALLVQCCCTLITISWKVSMHMAGAGAIVGGLMAYGFLLNYNPIWWICLALLISGVLGTSRMLLRQHSLGQVLAGFGVGFVCGLAGMLIRFV